MISTLTRSMIGAIKAAPEVMQWLSDYAQSDDWLSSIPSLEYGLSTSCEKICRDTELALNSNCLWAMWSRYFLTPQMAIAKMKEREGKYDREDFCYHVLAVAHVEKIDLGIKVPDIAYNQTIVCRFGDEQIQASGIKREYARLALSVLDEQHAAYTKDVHWLSPYAVLVDRGWIEDNIAAYCRTMNELFGVKLNYRNLSKTVADAGMEYQDWTADKRLRIRKELAEAFNRSLDDYLQRKRAYVMRDLN